ncbi:conserved exported hypothetical protein [Gammaproteobacteria bacterium]
MKKSFLAVAMGLSAVFGASVAQADALLFPHYQASSKTGVVSFLSLANVIGINAAVHYVWSFKLPGQTLGQGCAHEDAWGRLTGWDIIQQVVTAPSISHFDLVGVDTKDKSGPAYSLTDDAEGYLIVSNWLSQSVGSLDDASQALPESSLAGQLIYVDMVNKIYSGERGLNNPSTKDLRGPYGNPPYGAPNMNDGLEQGAWDSVYTSHPSFDLTWYPKDIVDTSWYLLATGRDMSGLISGQAQWDGTLGVQNGFNVVWDRDEVPRSGNRPLFVVCASRITRDMIMQPAQVTHTDNGGYMWMTLMPATTNLSYVTGGMLTKIEMSTAGVKASFGGNVVQAMSFENPWPNIPF